MQGSLILQSLTLLNRPRVSIDGLGSETSLIFSSEKIEGHKGGVKVISSIIQLPFTVKMLKKVVGEAQYSCCGVVWEVTEKALLKVSNNLLQINVCPALHLIPFYHR